VLGEHVNQKGSLVAPDRLRFDFSHFAPMKEEEIRAVERAVNRLIRQNHPVVVEHTDLEGARKAGATMLFGEKYDEDTVRMVKMGERSLELCGGTHTEHTGDIGVFKIVSEGSVQAGVRRIEALTGAPALERFQNLEHQALRAAEVLKAAPSELLNRLRVLSEREKKLSREVEELKQRVAASTSSDPSGNAREIEGIKALAVPTRGIKLAGLRDFADKQRDRMGGGVVMAFAEDRGKLSAVCSVSKELTKRLRAGDLLKEILQLTGGKGGGRPDFAQGGGGDPALLDKAIEAFYQSVERTLSGQA
jgi:alanyl-tRNA synthetase